MALNLDCRDLTSTKELRHIILTVILLPVYRVDVARLISLTVCPAFFVIYVYLFVLGAVFIPSAVVVTSAGLTTRLVNGANGDRFLSIGMLCLSQSHFICSYFSPFSY